MHARVLLADDHKMFAEALAKLLSQTYEIVGIASNGRELITLARELTPDVIVMDVSMPLLNGMEALRMLKRTAARAKFIVLTMHTDVSLAAEAFRCGASAFVLKQAAGEELSTAILSALRGRSYLSSAFPVDLVTLLAEAVRHRTEDGPKITRRQREVLQLVAEGKTMKDFVRSHELRASFDKPDAGIGGNGGQSFVHSKSISKCQSAARRVHGQHGRSAIKPHTFAEPSGCGERNPDKPRSGCRQDHDGRHG